MKKTFMKRQLIALLIFLMGLSTVSCAPLIYSDPTHRGKVVDAETGEPIEGAAAVGAWYKVYPTVAGASTKFYDLYETTTDRNGYFTIPGKGLRLMSIMDEMYFTLVKARYSFIDEKYWSDLAKNPNIEHEGQMLIFKLRKRSLDERRRSTPSSVSSAPDRMQRQLLKEINSDLKELGHSLYRIPEESK